MTSVSKMAIVSAGSLLSLWLAGTAATADITVATWGGAYELSQKRGFGDSWEKKTGKKINWVEYNGDMTEVRAQVESGEVLWDIVDVFAHEARLGCREGLFSRLPAGTLANAPDGTPVEQDLMIPRPNTCVAPNIIWSWMTFYDETRFPGDKPKTIADFFDVTRFPGKRGLSVFPQANIEMALVADGVDPKRVYEILSSQEGIDRAFAKLDTIKPYARFWSGGDEPVAFVESGEVAMSTVYSGRLGAATLGGADTLRPIWDGQVLDEEWLVMVKGSKNREEALDFLAHASAPEQLARQARWITYGPVRRSSLEIIKANEPWFNTGADVLPHLPNRPELMPRTIVADAEWWAGEGRAVARRFMDWMEK